jgi:hypothetical protein
MGDIFVTFSVRSIRCNLVTARILAATAAVLFTINHLFDTLIHGLLQIADNGGELAGGQTFVAGRTGGISFFEPAEGFVDRFVTVGASEVYFRF